MILTRSRLTTFGLALSFLAATATGDAPSVNSFLNNGVTAHRGHSAEYPENTIPAFKSGIELGADWIELDIFRTQDGKLVVIHDRTTGRVGDKTVNDEATMAQMLKMGIDRVYTDDPRRLLALKAKPTVDSTVLLLPLPSAVHAADYEFDGKISRGVLENYLSRSITMLDLLTGQGNLDDNIRMLKNIGAKFAGRTIYLWGGESQLPTRLAAARQNAPKIRAADPQMILQACVFEIVSGDVDKLPVPGWAFEAFGQSPEQRNFRYEAMLYPGGRGHNHWRKGSSIPDISQKETKLWFYFLAASYIDVGCEAIHFGQAEIMDGNDPEHRHWNELLSKVRQYAARHARRHWVLCDAHVPSGGLLHGDRLLLDFHSFPLRIVEVPERPQEGVLKMGAFDSIYGRSQDGVSPSGWRCEHLPYLVELDNWGVSNRPGQPHVGGCWVWGYDEISWFAHQDEAYRNQWLKYAWKWVREHDPNGFFQMPGSRVLHAPVDGHGWYYVNTRSDAVPQGFGQEETIKGIWSGNMNKESSPHPYGYGLDAPDIAYVGGEPMLIQNPHDPVCDQCGKPMRFLFQFGEVVPGVQMADAGVCYVYGCDDHPDRCKGFVDSH